MCIRDSILVIPATAEVIRIDNVYCTTESTLEIVKRAERGESYVYISHDH